MSAQVESPARAARWSADLPWRWWRRQRGLLRWAADRINPILVKETRQALKSRQFSITFGLLLLLCWAWTILGVAMIGPDVYYSAEGPDMFCGYYLILAFPLLVIVPFGAFRSLATEQEDRTYELLAITTLSPRQIISGKLGSAALQMMIYLSAITPCLAFTYMLQGIDFPTIVLLLSYTVLACLALSLVGLLAGTLTAEKHWQVVLSVILIAALLLDLFSTFSAVVAIAGENNIPFEDAEFWQASAAFLTAYLSYFLLLFYAAAARITFTADNRSTRLRAVMLLQHLLWAGWMAWVLVGPERGDEDLLYVFMSLAALHWYVMGALMTGESAELSPRVKRNLPQSFLGRMFLTWFNPGPGTGYLFAVCGLLGALAMVAVGVLVFSGLRLWDLPSWSSNEWSAILAFGLLATSYGVFYLGLGLLAVRLLRRVARVGVLLSVLINVLLVLLGVCVPLVIWGMSPQLRYDGYNLVQITNPFWTLGHVADGSSLPPEAPLLLVVVPLAALIVFLLNLPDVAREVRHVRIARPGRVAEEDAQLAAAKSPPKPVRISPWD